MVKLAFVAIQSVVIGQPLRKLCCSIKSRRMALLDRCKYIIVR